MEQAPRLSVVATSRNDDHGGHLVERMQWFVDGLAWNAERRRASTELLMVEWNPPDGRAPLAEILRWPAPESRLSVRILSVPPAEHTRLVGEGGMPMMQMIAKNVGIRRARGTNVLATNIDILFAPSLFDVCVNDLGGGAVWRADRHDVEFPFSAGVQDLEGALLWCEEHPVRYERRDGIYYPGRGRQLPIYQGVGDLLAWQAGVVRRRLTRAASHDGTVPTSAPHRPSGSSAADLAQFARGRARAFADLATLPKLNVNACGDFTLLTRPDWEKLRAYPEWVVHSLHLDTIFMHQAHAAGLDFVDIAPPSVAYHMEHSAGSGWTPEAQGLHMASVAKRGMPHITPERLRKEKRRLLAARRHNEAVVYNEESWGLADADVSEWTPQGGQG